MDAMMDTTLGAQMALGTMITFFIQLLKRSNLPGLRWINDTSDKAALAVSMVCAFFVAMGFKLLNVEGSFETGGHFTIGFPSAAAAYDGAQHFLAQFGINQLNYASFKGIFDKSRKD